MQSVAVDNRFIFRAEMRSSRDTVISYGFDLTASSIFVVTDWLPPEGTLVSLRISFPGVLAPLDVAARVQERRAAGAPGESSGVRLTFEVDSDEARGRLAAILERLRVPLDDAPPSRAYRVLLVEDNSFIRDMFAYGIGKFFQRRRGALVVEHAEDAAAAWEKLSGASYDLAIVDYYLPAEDGASLIARVRKHERLSRVAVVAISVGGRDAREATINAGADLFLDKPVVLRDLFNTLQILSQRGSDRMKKILVFDDSRLILEITRAALMSAGFEVEIAETLETFEHRRATVDPDLILVDVQMPEAFGDDVASTLRGWHGVRIPILLVSSLSEDELARRASEAEAVGYVCKAAGLGELVRRCREVLAIVPEAV